MTNKSQKETATLGAIAVATIGVAAVLGAFANRRRKQQLRSTAGMREPLVRQAAPVSSLVAPWPTPVRVPRIMLPQIDPVAEAERRRMIVKDMTDWAERGRGYVRATDKINLATREANRPRWDLRTNSYR